MGNQLEKSFLTFYLTNLIKIATMKWQTRLKSSVSQVRAPLQFQPTLLQLNLTFDENLCEAGFFSKTLLDSWALFLARIMIPGATGKKI